MKENPQLDQWRFDKLAGISDDLWGAKEIARVLNRSEDTVRRWAKKPGIPIYQPCRGQYYASRFELERWKRSK